MKRFLLGLSFVLSVCHADTLATARNGNNGLLVLTDVPCKDGGGFHMYSQSNNYRTLFGCWWSDNSMVHATYSDGETRSYPLDIWQVNVEVANRLKRKERTNL
jgi:hypothetical protein